MHGCMSVMVVGNALALAFFLVVAVLFHLAFDLAVPISILFLVFATFMLATLAVAAFVFPGVRRRRKRKGNEHRGQ